MAPETGAPTMVESKSAKKKRGKTERAASSTGTATPAPDTSAQALPSDLATNGVDGAHDSPYLKELNK